MLQILIRKISIKASHKGIPGQNKNSDNTTHNWYYNALHIQWLGHNSEKISTIYIYKLFRKYGDDTFDAIYMHVYIYIFDIYIYI